MATCVPGPLEMETAALGPQGLVNGIRSGAIYIDHTTNSPETVRRVGAAIRERHADMLDAPVDGGREGALAGGLTLFVGGERPSVQRSRPVLDSFSKRVVWMGELGSGSVTKIVHNALAMSIDLLLAECLTMGIKSGVGLPQLVKAIAEVTALGGNMGLRKRWPDTVFRGDFTARFALRLAHKDFGLAAELVGPIWSPDAVDRHLQGGDIGGPTSRLGSQGPDFSNTSPGRTRWREVEASGPLASPARLPTAPPLFCPQSP